MSFNEVFMITSNAAVSAALWFLILSVVFYLARGFVHIVIRTFSRGFQQGLRLSARSVMLIEKRMVERNREVLLNHGREAKERIVEREFERVDATVRRDLAEYPSLHRHLSEEITKIDEDYKESTEVPPAPPGWVKAVEVVAKIPASKDDPMVGKVLQDIHRSMMKAEDRATAEYRKSSSKRHSLLNRMMPHWRKLMTIMGQVDKNINSLLLRCATIDRHMEEYEQIVRRTDRAVRTLSSSSLTEFFISTFVLAIAIGGAVINFHLIARPLSEMVGGTGLAMGFKINNVAAMVIILVELTMGLFLMESMRITRLFPVIGALSDKARVRMAWAFFSILFFLATIEAGLAFMREILMEEDAATRAALRGVETGSEMSHNSFLWITTVSQMGMGFVLPFALMFVAIPLETFVNSLRTVLGVIGVALLRTVAWFLRLVGSGINFTGIAIINIYDVLIFGPLFIERIAGGKKNKKQSGSTNYRGATT